MSDIPLRSIRRNKARANYIPIADSDSPLSSDSPNMPINTINSNVTFAASTSTTSRRNLRIGKNARKDRYVDDPEEEAGLLQRNMYDDDGFGGEQEDPSSPDQVRTSSANWSSALIKLQLPTPMLLKTRHTAGKDSSRTIPFKPPGMFHQAGNHCHEWLCFLGWRACTLL